MIKKVTTISVSEEIKKKLESEKGTMSWEDFLLFVNKRISQEKS